MDVSVPHCVCTFPSNGSTPHQPSSLIGRLDTAWITRERSVIGWDDELARGNAFWLAEATPSREDIACDWLRRARCYSGCPHRLRGSNSCLHRFGLFGLLYTKALRKLTRDKAGKIFTLILWIQFIYLPNNLFPEQSLFMKTLQICLWRLYKLFKVHSNVFMNFCVSDFSKRANQFGYLKYS